MSAKKVEMKTEETFGWKDFLVGVVLVVGLMLAVYGAWTLGNDLRPDVEKLFTKAPAELSPGELVDAAMRIPGVIVLSPHRNLVELGMATGPGEVFLTSPAIAVHTKERWCIWELGIDRPFRGDGMETLDDITMIGSYNGYRKSYDDFVRCVYPFALDLK